MTEIPDDSVDLIMTSPPYPKGMREYEKDCCVEADQYVGWIAPMIRAAHRVLKISGSMVLVLMDKIVDGEIHPYIDDLKRFCRSQGFSLIDDILWFKCLAGTTNVYAKGEKGPMPMTVKDLARVKNASVWNGQKWTRVVSCTKLPQKVEMLQIVLRSGEIIKCTKEHRFPTNRGLVAASSLRRGDVLDTTLLPRPETPKDSEHVGLDAAWLAGLYLAEGSMSGDAIQISGHIKEHQRWERLQQIAKAYGGSITRTIKGNSMDIRLYGKLLVAIVKELIEGTNAENKCLAAVCWRYSNDFLAELLSGYLSGDGSPDPKNGRWAVGFCRNYLLERDLRVLVARLGAKITLKRGIVTGFGKKFPCCRGRIVFKKSKHPGIKNRSEVLEIKEAPMGWTYAISVEDEPHTFALASGVMTHNSNPLPNVNYEKRPIRSYEHCLWFAKNIKFYSWNGDNVRKRYSEATLNRYGAVGNISTLHRRSGGQANQTWVGVEPNPKGAACNNVIVGSRFSGRDPGHPAKFPEYLPEWFIRAMTNPQEVVLDPFSGSGTTLIAAKRADRKYVGYEIAEQYYKRAMSDLQHVHAEPDMFEGEV